MSSLSDEPPKYQSLPSESRKHTHSLSDDTLVGETNSPRPGSISDSTLEDNTYSPDKKEQANFLDISHSYRNVKSDSDQSSVSTEDTTDFSFDRAFGEQCDHFQEQDLASYPQLMTTTSSLQYIEPTHLFNSFTRLLDDNGPSNYYSSQLQHNTMQNNNSIIPLQSTLPTNNCYQPQISANDSTMSGDMDLMCLNSSLAHTTSFAMSMNASSTVSMNANSMTTVTPSNWAYSDVQPPAYKGECYG